MFTRLMKKMCINLIMNTTAKSSQTILLNLAGKRKIGKIFEGEMLIRILPTTLLQIFCKIILISQAIVKSIENPDDNFLEEFLSMNGLNTSY